jgi:hypothetical protein
MDRLSRIAEGRSLTRDADLAEDFHPGGAFALCCAVFIDLTFRLVCAEHIPTGRHLIALNLRDGEVKTELRRKH